MRVQPPEVHLGGHQFTLSHVETIRVRSLGPISLFTIGDLLLVTGTGHARRLAREAQEAWLGNAGALLEAAYRALDT